MEVTTVSTFSHGYALAPLAPLNAPLIAQVLHQQLATTSVVDAVSRYPASLAWLQRRLPQVRARVFQDLDSSVATGDLRVTDFLSLLRATSPAMNRPNPQVLSTWRGRGILQTPRRGYVRAQRAAAILIARQLVPTATRNWLPDEIAPNEPDWWCWRQDGPTSPITACPVPLPADLPSAALLWVPWAGAAWLSDWVPVATGALFSGGVRTRQALLAAAATWDFSLDPALQAALDAADQAGAGELLARQAWGRLATPLVLARFNPIRVPAN